MNIEDMKFVISEYRSKRPTNTNIHNLVFHLADPDMRPSCRPDFTNPTTQQLGWVEKDALWLKGNRYRPCQNCFARKK